MPGLFARIGGGVDWLFGAVGGSIRGAITAPEALRIIGVGIASALSGATPFLAAAAASRSRTELGAALYSGFLTGVAGGAVSYLHRRCDGNPYAPPPPAVHPDGRPRPPNRREPRPIAGVTPPPS